MDAFGTDLLDLGFVDIGDDEGIVRDIRYATPVNFLGRPVYGSFDRVILHPVAAAKLRRAVALLARRAPASRLLVFDALRPNRIQRLMWDAVRGTPQQIYVGDPAVGSIHGYGLAIDVSLVDGAGREVDMGTPFDDFSPLSEPRREADHVAQGVLTTAQLDNRRLLRRTMTDAGFHPIPIEWWHFDALPPDEVRRNHVLVE